MKEEEDTIENQNKNEKVKSGTYSKKHHEVNKGARDLYNLKLQPKKRKRENKRLVKLKQTIGAVKNNSKFPFVVDGVAGRMKGKQVSD